MIYPEQGISLINFKWFISRNDTLYRNVNNYNPYAMETFTFDKQEYPLLDVY